MATWNSRGLRGSTLEELINFTIEKYEESNIALIQKIPTPIKPININHDTRQITLAYFDKKSTVDYIGAVQLRDEAYYLPYRDIRYFYDRAADGGRKSFRYDEIDKNYLIRRSQGVPLHFLEALNLDLCSRN